MTTVLGIPEMFLGNVVQQNGLRKVCSQLLLPDDLTIKWIKDQQFRQGGIPVSIEESAAEHERSRIVQHLRVATT